MRNKLNLIYRPYEEVQQLIKEGDVLLFRGQSFTSKIIQAYGEGSYSHVGVASWSNGSDSPILECVEFREGKGGRTVNLKRQVEYNDCLIDVYRPIPFFTNIQYNKDAGIIKVVRKPFNGKLVTNTMRRMTGLPYGWRRIWWIFKRKMVILRLFYSREDLVDDTTKEVIYPVCSTATSYAFSKDDFDLIKNKSDNWTEPSHIATSARLNYLFTLCIKDRTNGIYA